jgi:hypothetical protein
MDGQGSDIAQMLKIFSVTAFTSAGSHDEFTEQDRGQVNSQGKKFAAQEVKDHGMGMSPLGSTDQVIRPQRNFADKNCSKYSE